MIPLKICLENCVELISDQRRRVLSGEAREFADSGFAPRDVWEPGSDYFDGVKREHEKLFWLDVYSRRKQRIARMQGIEKQWK